MSSLKLQVRHHSRACQRQNLELEYDDHECYISIREEGYGTILVVQNMGLVSLDVVSEKHVYVQ